MRTDPPARFWRRRGPVWFVVAGLILAVLGTAPAFAHRTKLTDALIQVEGAEVSIWLGTSAHDIAVALGRDIDLEKPVPVALLRAAQRDFERYVSARLSLRADAGVCSAKTPDFIRRQPGEGSGDTGATALPEGANPDDYAEQIVIRARFTCPAVPRWLAVDYQMFFEIDQDHRAIGSVEGSGRSQKFLFDREVRQLTFQLAGGATVSGWAKNVWGLFVLGLEHILKGYDHLLFLATLLMVIATFWNMVSVVTAFTVAHSLTLALAWFGVLNPPVWLVETVIALSIAYVAIENLAGRAGNHRWMVAAGFGLVHGLGFYSVLKSLEFGQSDVVSTLLAFNLGVEAGQVTVLLVLIVPLIWWWQQPWYAISARIVNLAILAVALWWAAERSFLA